MSATASGERSVAVETMIGGLVATGDITVFVQGLDTLATDYSGRIQNFLAEYVGSGERPVPFGGRQEALALADAWLEGDGNPPYLLLSAPAGRGKSALLVQWCDRVSKRPDYAVVFVPVSIRFNTNLESVVFAAATARLAALHGEKIPGDAHTSAQMWRALMTEYLRRPLPDGRRLLVVLDGLDEAANWDAGADLFPENPPQGVRALVSVRDSASEMGASRWLGRLGWEKPGKALAFGLDLLTENGVAEALTQMGFPLDRLSGRVDIVAQLHRLSEGEPLLVRLYVDDLWSRGEEAVRLTPEDLQTIPPGLEAYMDRWWDDQRQLWGPYQPLRESQVRFVLKALAFALGPLQQEDVLRLAPPEIDLDSLLLDEAIRPLNRLIIGDGRKRGYAFSHPRLSNFFAEKWQADRGVMQNGFLNLGRQTVIALRENRLPPDKASRYIVQYYGAHLEGASADPDAWLELASDGWRQAWEALEGSFSGFLTDIERIWRAISQRNEALASVGAAPSWLVSEALCALCKASINSLAGEIPPKLLESLLAQQVWTTGRGLAHARQVPNPVQQIRSLACVSRHLKDPQKSAVLAEALSALEAIDHEPDRGGLLAELAPDLSESLLTPALKLTGKIAEEKGRAWVLWKLASHLTEPVQIQSLAIVRSIGDEYQRAEALAALAPHLAEAAQAEALELAGAFEAEKERAWVLGRLAAQLPEVLLGKSLAIVRSIGDGYQRAEALAGLAPQLAGAPLAEALELAGAFEDEKERAWLLGRLAPHLPEPLQGRSLAIARSIGDEYQRAEALAGLAPQLSQPMLRQALEAAQAFADEGERAWTLGAVGMRFSGTERTRTLADALATVRVIKDEGRKAWALRELAPHLPEALLEEALEVAQEMQGPASRASALSSVAPRLAPASRKEVLALALATARLIADATERAATMRILAPHLPEALEAKAWAELLALPLTITNLQTQQEAQAILKPFAEASGAQQTLHAVADLQKPIDYNVIFSEMASRLPGPLLAETFDAIPEKTQVDAWEKLLPVLGPHLPESSLRTALTNTLKRRTLAALAPYLPESLLVVALDASRRLVDADERTAALIALVPHLSGKLQEEAIVEALKAAPGMSYQGKWKGVLSALAPHLSEPLMRQALAVARAIKRTSLQTGVTFDRIVPWDFEPSEGELDERADALAALAPYLTEPLLVEAIAAARALEDRHQRAKALAALAPRLSPSLLAEAEVATRTIGDVSRRAWLLSELERNLPKSARFEELDAARAFLAENPGPFLLRELSEYNTAPNFFGALSKVESIRNKAERANAWVQLAPRLPASLWSSSWRDALAAAKSNWDSGKRIRALAGLSAYLPDPHGAEAWSEVMQAAYQIKSESERKKTLAEFGCYEPDRLQAKELIDARQLEDGFAKALALAKIAPRLPTPQRVEILREAFAAARALENSGKRVSAFIELSVGLEGLNLSALYDLWRGMLPILARRSRADLLVDLWASQGFLYRLGGSEATTGIFRAVYAIGQWWP